jgi:2-methylaconitate cis-trans-isomerase PrpF
VADVQVKNGKAAVTGDCVIAGVPGSSAPILLDFAGTTGAVTGKALPTGKSLDVIGTSRGPIEASIVDVANPCIFVHAHSVGMTGTESPDEVDGNPELLAYLEELRARCAVIIGMAETMEEASRDRPAIPMPAFVAEPQVYVSYGDGKVIRKEDVDLVSRLMFMQRLHKAYAGSCTACTGVAAKIPGTVVNRVLSGGKGASADTVRIGHPGGVLPVMASVENGFVTRASLFRTARRIMEGYAFIEKSRLEMP